MTGPPGGGGAPTPENADHTITYAAEHHQDGTADSRRFDDLAARARRRRAAIRSTVISTCSCSIRDPDVDKHTCGHEITDVQAAAAVAAVILLDQLGTPGLLDERTCRAMHRIGHRKLAAAVHRRTAGAS